MPREHCVVSGRCAQHVSKCLSPLYICTSLQICMVHQLRLRCFHSSHPLQPLSCLRATRRRVSQNLSSSVQFIHSIFALRRALTSTASCNKIMVPLASLSEPFYQYPHGFDEAIVCNVSDAYEDWVTASQA